MNRTLLDYLLNRVDEADAREFQRVLGADKNQLFNWVSDIYGGDKKKEQNFFDKVTEVLFGKRKSALDMTPEELDRLTRLSLTSKEVAEFELHIQPDMLSEEGREKSSQDMEYVVNKFYLDNKLYFESPDDISFDPDTWTLEYKGRKRLAKKLLRLMGVQEKYVDRTVDKGSKGSVSLKIPLIDLVDTDDPKFEDINQATADEIENELHQLAGRDVQVEVVPGRTVAQVTAAPKDQLNARDKFNQKNIQKQEQQKQKPKPSLWNNRKDPEEEESEDPKKPGSKPDPKEPRAIIDPQLKLKGHKMDIYNVLKKSQLLDQQKVDQIFEGDLRKYMS